MFTLFAVDAGPLLVHWTVERKVDFVVGIGDANSAMRLLRKSLCFMRHDNDAPYWPGACDGNDSRDIRGQL